MTISSIIATQSVLDGCNVAWDSTAMTGTARCVSEALDLGSKVAGVSMVVPWANTGTVVGTFDVEVSNDGVSWFGTTPSGGAVSNTAGPRRFEFSTHSRYARLVYTNTSGTGTLSEVAVHGNRR